MLIFGLLVAGAGLLLLIRRRWSHSHAGDPQSFPRGVPLLLADPAKGSVRREAARLVRWRVG